VIFWCGSGPGSVPPTNGSGSGGFKDERKNFCIYFFPDNLSTGTLFSVAKITFFCFKISVKILFCKHYFSPLNTFMRKGKDPDPKNMPCRSGSGSGSVSPTLFLQHYTGIIRTSFNHYVRCTKKIKIDAKQFKNTVLTIHCFIQ
jgi:hypothetical protein